jgi:hypothetical protein
MSHHSILPGFCVVERRESAVESLGSPFWSQDAFADDQVLDQTMPRRKIMNTP